jgi:hypothetical protein
MDSVGEKIVAFARHPGVGAPPLKRPIDWPMEAWNFDAGHAKLKLTMFYLATRGVTIKAESFPDRWIRHLALFESLDLEKAPFTSNKYLLIERGPDFEPIVKCGFVGISIMTLDDLEALMRFGNKYRDAIKKMKIDEAEAFGGDIDLKTCIGDRHVVIDGPRKEFALILLRQRKAEVGESEFHAVWMDYIGRILVLVHGSSYPSHVAHTRVTQCATAAAGYSGMTEFWFESIEEVHACMTAMGDADLSSADAEWIIPARSVTIPVFQVKPNYF